MSPGSNRLSTLVLIMPSYFLGLLKCSLDCISTHAVMASLRVYKAGFHIPKFSPVSILLSGDASSPAGVVNTILKTVAINSFHPMVTAVVSPL